jgi:hypothetical protein
MSCLNFIKRSKAERSRGGKMKYGVSGHDRRITFRKITLVSLKLAR